MKQIINEQIVVPKITASIIPDRGLFWKDDDEKEKQDDKGIRINAKNWNEYLKVIQKVYTDSSVDGKAYTRGINYLLKLKEEYVEKLDSAEESTLYVNTRYKQSLVYAQYKDGKLNVGEKVTAKNADERVLVTFHCTNQSDFAEMLAAQEAEEQKEELTIHNRDLRNGAAIGWFGLQRYSSSNWTDDEIFAYWCAADFAITRLEGVIYLKD